MSGGHTPGSSSMWLVWASQGEYSDRSEWPVAVCHSEADGEAVTVRLGQLWRELHAIYKRRENELERVGDWDGETLFDTTDEGRELLGLSGARGGLSSYYAGDRSYTCCEVRILSAEVAAIARARGEA